MPPVNTGTQGRRGYYLYEYGTHLWFPQTVSDFSGGVFRDPARVAIPGNGVYDSLDFMLDRAGIAYKRGGTSYASTNNAVLGTTNYFAAVAYPVFPGAAALLGIGDDGTYYNSLGSDPSTLFYPVGNGVVPVCKPAPFISATSYLIIPDSTQAATPTMWSYRQAVEPLGASVNYKLTITGTPTGGNVTVNIYSPTHGGIPPFTIAFNASAANVQTAINNALSAVLDPGTVSCSGGSLPGTAVTITRPGSNHDYGFYLSATALTGGSSPAATLAPSTNAAGAPAAKFACSHLSRIVLANTIANPDRLFFSPVTDVTSAWNTGSAWADVNGSVSGLASINQSTLIVFSSSATEKLVGDTPPPGSNFTQSTVGPVGCTDARSITTVPGGVIFGNKKGIFQTDGQQITALMDGRIASYWQGLGVSSIATGLYARRWLFVTALDGSRAFLTSLIRDMQTGAWWRISQPRTLMYAERDSSVVELYAGGASTGRVFTVSGFYNPSSSNKNDADGTAVTPTLELRPFGGGPGLGAFGKGHVTYDMRDAASDNPTLAVSVAPGLEATTYGAVAESPLAETTDATRARYSTGKRSQALSVKFAQTNASSKTEIYMVEQDTRGFPREAGGQ